MSTIAEICIRQNMAMERFFSVRGTFEELIRTARRAMHEAVLDFFDEPQVAAMADDGCPNHGSTGGQR